MIIVYSKNGIIPLAFFFEKEYAKMMLVGGLNEWDLLPDSVGELVFSETIKYGKAMNVYVIELNKKPIAVFLQKELAYEYAKMNPNLSVKEKAVPPMYAMMVRTML